MTTQLEASYKKRTCGVITWSFPQKNVQIRHNMNLPTKTYLWRQSLNLHTKSRTYDLTTWSFIQKAVFMTTQLEASYKKAVLMTTQLEASYKKAVLMTSQLEASHKKTYKWRVDDTTWSFVQKRTYDVTAWSFIQKPFLWRHCLKLHTKKPFLWRQILKLQ